MAAILTWLRGNKTILGMAALTILGLCYSQGWINDDLAQGLGIVIGGLTGVMMKVGQNRTEKKIDVLIEQGNPPAGPVK